MVSEKDRELDTNKAIKMLPDGEHIHTFRNTAGMLLGADWDRKDIIIAIKRYGVEFSGEQAIALEHGLVLNDGSFLFIETKKLT